MEYAARLRADDQHGRDGHRPLGLAVVSAHRRRTTGPHPRRRVPARVVVALRARFSAEFGVVRNTLRRALAELDRERLIETVPGRGRLVRDGSPERPALRYRQIAADLAAAITAGDLRPGDELPSEAALARRYGVSRGTARQAFAELTAAGLVETRQGRLRRVRPV